jgi:hypothetical protein
MVYSRLFTTSVRSHFRSLFERLKFSSSDSTQSREFQRQLLQQLHLAESVALASVVLLEKQFCVSFVHDPLPSFASLPIPRLRFLSVLGVSTFVDDSELQSDSSSSSNAAEPHKDGLKSSRRTTIDIDSDSIIGDEKDVAILLRHACNDSNLLGLNFGRVNCSVLTSLRNPRSDLIPPMTFVNDAVYDAYMEQWVEWVQKLDRLEFGEENRTKNDRRRRSGEFYLLFKFLPSPLWGTHPVAVSLFETYLAPFRERFLFVDGDLRDHFSEQRYVFFFFLYSFLFSSICLTFCCFYFCFCLSMLTL